MLRWLRNWWKRRTMAAHRDIFEFWDGQAYRNIDPWRAFRDIRDDAKFNLEEHPELIADSGAEPETTYMALAVCRAFGVERFDGKKGLTDQELMELLTDLVIYLRDLQKKTDFGSTPLPLTDLESSIGPEPPPATTNSSSPCSIPSTGSNSDGEPLPPTPSPPEQAEACCL